MTATTAHITTVDEMTDDALVTVHPFGDVSIIVPNRAAASIAPMLEVLGVGSPRRTEPLPVQIIRIPAIECIGAARD